MFFCVTSNSYILFDIVHHTYFYIDEINQINHASILPLGRGKEELVFNKLFVCFKVIVLKDILNDSEGLFNF